MEELIKKTVEIIRDYFNQKFAILLQAVRAEH